MRQAALGEDEIARRLPVWTALADTFLDTQLDPGDYRQMAETILAAGFDPGEAETIYRHEVAPAFAGNLVSVAGEWEGWSPDFVRARVLESRRSRLKRLSYRLLMGDEIDAQWAQGLAALERA